MSKATSNGFVLLRGMAEKKKPEDLSPYWNEDTSMQADVLDCLTPK